MAADVAFISDIHGNRVALEAVLDAVRRQGITRIVCLGDIVDLGPQPQACVDRVRQERIPCIRGNHDSLDEVVAPPLSEVQAWTASQLTGESRAWLRELPESLVLQLDGKRVVCTHASPRNLTDGLLVTTPDDELDELLSPAEPYDAVVAGHTHVQMLRRRGARTIVNAGSVGMPFEAPVRATPPRIFRWAEYAVLRVGDGRSRFELCRAPYAFPDFAASFDDSFPHRQEWLQHWVP